MTTISRAELQSGITDGTLVVVDALPASYYHQQHLPGAVNLSLSDVTDHAAEVLPDRHAAIVTYCANAACPNSVQVARALRQRGYTNVREYREGIQDWVEAGLPIIRAAA